MIIWEQLSVLVCVNLNSSSMHLYYILEKKKSVAANLKFFKIYATIAMSKIQLRHMKQI